MMVTANYEGMPTRVEAVEVPVADDGTWVADVPAWGWLRAIDVDAEDAEITGITAGTRNLIVGPVGAGWRASDFVDGPLRTALHGLHAPVGTSVRVQGRVNGLATCGKIGVAIQSGSHAAASPRQVVILGERVGDQVAVLRAPEDGVIKAICFDGPACIHVLVVGERFPLGGHRWGSWAFERNGPFADILAGMRLSAGFAVRVGFSTADWPASVPFPRVALVMAVGGADV